MEYRFGYITKYESGWTHPQLIEIPAESDADASEKANQQIERMREHAPSHVKGYEISHIDRIEQREITTRIYFKE